MTNVLDTVRQIATIQSMTVAQLQKQYAEVFGEVSRSNHREYFVRKIAWRIQANAEGGLSERARQRAMQIANDQDIRTRPPKAMPVVEIPPATQSDMRLPMPGTILQREFKGKTHRVMVLAKGFEFDGQTFRSLSAVAKAITGAHWNGFLFFGMENRKEVVK